MRIYIATSQSGGEGQGDTCTENCTDRQIDIQTDSDQPPVSLFAPPRVGHNCDHGRG